ncbi:UNVERIFIED_CONTAM: putative MO25-like protein [Sesamum angustifolium]|uniref:MO25-like protein n=1 Tax=Sesamum angustifolium TaxID=2727405 RepID=A0AAW2PFJ7_9LAMI
MLDRRNHVIVLVVQESHKSIQIDAFHVFKVSPHTLYSSDCSHQFHHLTLVYPALVQLFVANQNKPADIVNILCANRTKLLRFLTGFNMDKEDEMFEADKAQVMKEITELEPTTSFSCSGELFKPISV